MNRIDKKRNVTPAQAIKMLKKEGIDVNEKQATEILDFLYLLAEIAVKQCLISPDPDEHS